MVIALPSSMEGYTHTVMGSYILNEQIINLIGKAKVSEREGNLEVILTESYYNKTYTLTGDIISDPDFIIIDIIEQTDENHIGPLILYNASNSSQSNFDGRYDGERSEIYLSNPSEEDLESLNLNELVDKTLSDGNMLKKGRPATLIFRKIKN